MHPRFIRGVKIIVGISVKMTRDTYVICDLFISRRMLIVALAQIDLIRQAFVGQFS